MRRLAVVSAIAVLAGMSSFGATEAAVLNIPLTGSCDAFPHSPPSCANVGLPVLAADVPLGSIDLDDSSYSPGGFFENEAFVSYNFSFGDFSLSNDDAPVTAFSGSWGATPGSILDLTMHAYASDDREHPGPLVGVGIGSNGGFLVASHDGYLEPILGGETNNGNWAGFTLDRDVAPIPLPAPLLLMGSGFAGLFALRWRRRASEVSA